MRGGLGLGELWRGQLAAQQGLGREAPRQASRLEWHEAPRSPSPALLSGSATGLGVSTPGSGPDSKGLGFEIRMSDQPGMVLKMDDRNIVNNLLDVIYSTAA